MGKVAHLQSETIANTSQHVRPSEAHQERRVPWENQEHQCWDLSPNLYS